MGKSLELRTFYRGDTTNDVELKNSVLMNKPCGLFRASFADVFKHRPELTRAMGSLPQEVIDNVEDYEFDVKVHMLKKGQFPCIPNWHCDFVPRFNNGDLNYSQLVDLPNHMKYETLTPMYLWVSGSPLTEFLASSVSGCAVFKDHGELGRFIDLRTPAEVVKMPEQTWVGMDQLTPHRGTAATSDCWRVFIRVMHKSILPVRNPDIGVIRHHSQVYLDSNKFNW